MNYFLFEVGVEISDHPLTADLSTHALSVVLQVGNIFMQGKEFSFVHCNCWGNLINYRYQHFTKKEFILETFCEGMIINMVVFKQPKS